MSVGELQGKGVVNGLTANGSTIEEAGRRELNGWPTDNNSSLFSAGYNSVLNPKYKNGTFKKGPDQSVPGWDNQKARTIFERMLAQTNNKIEAVAAANDGLGNAAVSALKAKRLKPIPLTGQDATAQGVQNIISGWQSMTVWKDDAEVATRRPRLADRLLKGRADDDRDGRRTAARTSVRASSTPVVDHEERTRSSCSGRLPQAVGGCRGEYAQYC